MLGRWLAKVNRNDFFRSPVNNIKSVLFSFIQPTAKDALAQLLTGGSDTDGGALQDWTGFNCIFNL